MDSSTREDRHTINARWEGKTDDTLTDSMNDPYKRDAKWSPLPKEGTFVSADNDEFEDLESQNFLEEHESMDDSHSYPSIPMLSRRPNGTSSRTSRTSLVDSLHSQQSDILNELRIPSNANDSFRAIPYESKHVQMASLRCDYEKTAMSRWDRFFLGFVNSARLNFDHGSRKQYKVTSVRQYRGNNRFCKNFHARGMCCAVSKAKTDRYNCERLIGDFVIWCFQTSTCTLFSTFLVMYMVFTLIFTGLFMIIGVTDPDCFAVSGYEDFHDAFALSWSTLTTVGYGYTSPENVPHCGWIHMLCLIESFSGDLYAGMVGAILFGKVIRIQRRAHIMFSDPIVVKYGSGLEDQIDCGAALPLPTSLSTKRSPCPVLELRVVNRLTKKYACELLECTVTCVAVKDVKEQALERGTSRRFSSGMGETIRLYANIKTHSSEHPYVKRLWTVKHTLDKDSALLSDAAVQRIEENGGYWPAEYNNYKAIRDSLQFNHIIVTFKAVSNVTASQVYGNKVYESMDVNVGYDFVTPLYPGSKDIYVDMALVSDIIEQNGGGAEPLGPLGSNI